MIITPRFNIAYRRMMFEPRFKIAYGGEKTILIDKDTGKKLAIVTRERGDKPDLEMAVLYLLLKYRGIGGGEIEKQIASSGCIYSYSEFLEWIILEGANLYSIDRDILNKYKTYVFGDDSGEQNSFLERQKGFMYVILDMYFRIDKETVKDLISKAYCSETQKTKLRRLKKKSRKKVGRKDKNEQESINK